MRNTKRNVCHVFDAESNGSEWRDSVAVLKINAYHVLCLLKKQILHRPMRCGLAPGKAVWGIWGWTHMHLASSYKNSLGSSRQAIFQTNQMNAFESKLPHWPIHVPTSQRVSAGSFDARRHFHCDDWDASLCSNSPGSLENLPKLAAGCHSAHNQTMLQLNITVKTTRIDYKDSTHDSPTSERLYDSRCAWLIKEGHKLKAISMINLPNR